MSNNIEMKNDIPEGRDPGVKNITTTSIPAEMLARGLISLSQYKELPSDVVNVLHDQALAGNREASFFLLDQKEYVQLPDSVESAVMENLARASLEGVPFAQAIHGCILLLSKSPRKIRHGLKLINKAAKGGCVKGLWDATLILAENMPSVAAECAFRAVSLEFSPALDAFTIAKIFMNDREAKFIKEQEASLGALRRDAYGEARQIESELVEFKQRLSEANAKNASLNGQVQEWQKRCEDARAQLTSLNAETMRDKMVAQLQTKVNHAEEEWLNAKLESENAEAAMVEAETVANDLARRNKYLVGLLRKNGIPFNEYESSFSSEEDGPPMGIAS